MDLTDLREIARNIFLLSIAALVIAFIIRLNNPLLYPNLEKRLIWFCFFSGLAAAILYFPELLVLAGKRSGLMKLGCKKGNSYSKQRSFGNNGSDWMYQLRNLGKMDREYCARLLLKWSFEFLLVAYLSLTLVRMLFADFALFVDSNYLLLSVVLLGAFSIYFPPKSLNSKEIPAGKGDYIFACLMGIAG